jgi:hypothetical protein
MTGEYTFHLPVGIDTRFTALLRAYRAVRGSAGFNTVIPLHNVARGRIITLRDARMKSLTIGEMPE